MTVPSEEASANSVPAAAVRRRMQALSGIIGRKEFVGGLSSLVLKAMLNHSSALETDKLESSRGKGNSQCSGEMRRYWEEHQWRKRLAGLVLTLRNESQGSEWD